VISRYLQVVGLVASILSGSLVLAGEASNRFDVDFSGSWELDYQLSDHPNEKIRWEYVQARSEAQRMLERAQNAGRYVDPSVMNYQAVIGLGRLTEKIAEATVLTISQRDDRIVVNRNDDFALICNFADLNINKSTIGFESCAWEADQLTFRISLPDGLNVFHRLSIAADRSRLNVATTVRLKGIHHPFTLNRVYMPFEPGEGQYQCEYTVASQTTCTLGDSDQ
jgi:hypothetical protein